MISEIEELLAEKQSEIEELLTEMLSVIEELLAEIEELRLRSCWL